MSGDLSVALPAAGAAQRRRGISVHVSGLSKTFPVRRGLRAALSRPHAGAVARVLHDVSCDIEEGEFFGLLGPNGAGKTTLFKLLATLIVPDAGSATVAGHDIVREPASVRRVLTPVIADERSLHWRISAEENLALFAALHGLRGAAARERVRDVLGIVGLADAGTKLVGGFSSGMKQRLLIARALVSRPRVLLLDEPTRSLDPISARAFRAFLREEISGLQRCTILLATHNAEEALELCDRVAVLDHGRLLAVGPAQELSLQYGGERYGIWSREPEHSALTSLVEQRVVRGVSVAPRADDGWSAVTLEIPGGPDRAAMVLHYLTVAGMSIARFERTQLSLADLIERIIGGVGHAPGAR
ncbi:MAG: ABC transporter ATP-binding protein [Gemmatimonadaceae bacterium]